MMMIFVIARKCGITLKELAYMCIAIDSDKDASRALDEIVKESSKQEYISRINGNAPCSGHTECDAIIMDQGCVLASPQLTANHVDASLIHEAAIGKIAGEQLMKLMTLGLNEKEAEEQIINGFLK